MTHHRLMWQIFPSFLVITFLSLLAVAVFGTRTIKNLYISHLTDDLITIASLVDREIDQTLSIDDQHPVASAVNDIASIANARITVIDPDGRVIVDSDEDPATMDNHADRPEVSAAIAGGLGVATRFSYTLGTPMLYVAVPGIRNGSTHHITRVAVAVSSIETVLRSSYVSIFVGWIVIAGIAAVVSLYIARRIAKPAEEIRRAAEQLAEGDLRVRVPVHASSEMVEVSNAMNRAAALLEERVNTLVRQRNEQEAVLSSMVEGVIAVNMEDRIISVNRAAAQLLGVNVNTVAGRLMQEVIRNTELHQFIRRTLDSDGPVEGDLTYQRVDERFLQAHGTVLRDAQDRGIGALVVLNDVTRLRRLEQIRSEFVANVSHELKTPITSIKGFVETLRDGALDHPEDARRFLEIVSRHSDRLQHIVDDLLMLSRLERETEHGDIEVDLTRVASVVDAAVQLCQVQAEQKDIRIQTQYDENLQTLLNAPLVEQALVNLIDNAIKYSEPGSTVGVAVELIGKEIALSVRDEGVGIEERFLDRIFERFYRVDRARSRELGGTGLGLSIVKHIANAHRGRITVQSVLGEGSTFTFYLPYVEA